MNKSILWMELRRSFKGLTIWSIAVGVTMLLVIAMYPLVKDMMDNIPEELASFIETFGGLPDNAMEYYATEGGILLQLLGAIFAALLGFGAISREERERTTDAVFVLPVSRTTFFLTKLVSVFLQVMLFSLVILLFIVIGLVAISGFEKVGAFFIYMLLHILMLLFVASLGFAMGAILRGGTKQMLSLLIPFPLYIIFFVSTLTDNAVLQKLKHITPFTFSDPVVLLKDAGNMDWISLVLFLGLTIVFLTWAYFVFKKKEFKA